MKKVLCDATVTVATETGAEDGADDVGAAAVAKVEVEIWKRTAERAREEIGEFDAAELMGVVVEWPARAERGAGPDDEAGAEWWKRDGANVN